MVLLTFTATATPTVVSPTARPTMTIGEKKLFDELVKCGSLADKGIHDAYEAGVKDGRHDQYCFVQCRMLKVNKEFLQEKIEDDAKQDKTLLGRIGLVRPYMSVRKYEDDVNHTKQIIKEHSCDCSEYEEEK